MSYFQKEYDVSDSVQNNLIVLNQQLREKHDRIWDNMEGLLSRLPTAANVLEIACGQGALTRRMALRFLQWTCTGIDPSFQAELEKDNPTNVEFIRDFFKTSYFQGKRFDLVVAHGILNRTPTLKLMSHIASLLKPGGVLSLEVVTLENSDFSPFIWDHSFTYSERALTAYLEYFGFEIIERFDCVSTIQIIARLVGAPSDSNQLRNSRDIVSHTKQIHNKNTERVLEAVGAFEEFSRKQREKRIGLFGAGLYTCVLLHLIDRERIHFIIDELKFGRELLRIPIIDFKSAKEISPATAFLFCRSQYQNVIKDKLRIHGIEVADAVF